MTLSWKKFTALSRCFYQLSVAGFFTTSFYSFFTAYRDLTHVTYKCVLLSTVINGLSDVLPYEKEMKQMASNELLKALSSHMVTCLGLKLIRSLSWAFSEKVP